MRSVLSAAPHLDPAVLAAADAITADPIKNLVIKVLGSLFVAFLAWRLFRFWATTAWGMIALEIVGAVVISFFVITPDTALTTLATLRTQIFPAG